MAQAHYIQIESLRQLGQLEAAFRSSQTAIARYADEHFEAQRETMKS